MGCFLILKRKLLNFQSEQSLLVKLKPAVGFEADAGVQSPSIRPKADESGQEAAWGKIDFNGEMKEEAEGNAVTWKTAAGSRDERDSREK